MTVADMNRAKQLPGANLGGAPFKVTPALLDKAKAFIQGDWQKYNKTVPTIEALAEHLDLYRSYVYAVPELADTRDWIQRTQAYKLIEHGLTGEYNSGIVKLLLSAKHGYIERTSTDVTSNGETVGANDAISAEFAEFAKRSTAVEGELVEQPKLDKPKQP